MSKKLVTSLFVAGLCSATPAMATTIQLTGGMTAVAVGSQASGGSGVAVFNMTETGATATGHGCLYSTFYIDLSSAAGRSMYNAVLAAQLTGQKLARVEFSGGGGAVCWVSLLVLAP